MKNNVPTHSRPTTVQYQPVQDAVWTAAGSSSGSYKESEETKLGFEEIWIALRRGVKSILLVAVAVVGLTVGYTLLLPTEYAADSIVSILTTEGNSGQTAIDAVSMPIGRHSIASEMGRLRHSQELSRRVAARLIEADSVLDSRAYFPILETERGEQLDLQNIAYRLSDQVEFTALQEQDMIEITAESTVPEEAARIANLYAEEYRKLTLEESRASVVATRTFLEEQVSSLSDELDEIDDQVVSFSQNRRLPQQGYAGEQLVQEYATYRAQQDQTRLQIDAQQHALSVIEEELSRVAPEGEITRPRTQGLEAEISMYDQQIADLRLQAEPYYNVNPELRGNEEEEPELDAIADQISRYELQRENLIDRLDSMTEGIPTVQDEAYIAQLRTQRAERQASLRGLQAQSQSLSSRVGSYAGRLQGIPRQNVELAQLERRRSVVNSFYGTFLSELQRTLIAEESELGYVNVVSTASTPRFPVRPNMTQNIVLGLLLGLGLGVGLALVRHATDRQLRRPEELQLKGYRILGVVPKMDRQIKALLKGADNVELEGKSVSSRLMTRIDPWSPITENFRLIRTNLNHSFSIPPQVLLITSAEMGAGKTVTSANLAVAMASGGQKTLLIGADMRRPAGHLMLGENNKVTFASILSGANEKVLARIESHQQNGQASAFDRFKTDVDDLSFLPAGEAEVPPSELIGSENFEKLLKAARDVFDVILIDSPPVLVATDAVLLGNFADASMMVVSANQTDFNALEQARETLEGVGLPLAGLVVNRFDDSKGTSYSYGYSQDYANAYSATT